MGGTRGAVKIRFHGELYPRLHMGTTRLHNSILGLPLVSHSSKEILPTRQRTQRSSLPVYKRGVGTTRHGQEFPSNGRTSDHPSRGSGFLRISSDHRGDQQVYSGDLPDCCQEHHLPASRFLLAAIPPSSEGEDPDVQSKDRLERICSGRIWIANR